MIKHQPFIHLLLALLFCCCWSVPGSGGGPGSSTKAPSNPESQSYHTPAEILGIMEKSSIEYTIAMQKDIVPYTLKTTGQMVTADPYARLVAGENGTKNLIIDAPAGEIQQLFTQAQQEFEKSNYAEARRIYEKAMKLNPDYFKTWTNLGDTLYRLGDFQQAEKMLLHAIEMNNVGYQEYLFLADVYDKMGKGKESIEAAVHAFMLNGKSSTVKMIVSRLLNKNSLKIRESRLEFPFQIRRDSADQCTILFREEEGISWMAMANCVACWTMEPDLQARLNHPDSGLNSRAQMFRDCLVNQMVSMEMKKEDGLKLTASEDFLYRAIKEGFLEAIIFWENLAGMTPDIILLLPKEEQDRMIDYIRKFVIEQA